jgi:hypothetical protein
MDHVLLSPKIVILMSLRGAFSLCVPLAATKQSPPNFSTKTTTS